MARWLFIALTLLASSLSFAQAKYVEGTNFFRLKEPQPVSTGNKIEVLEVFSYACIHCAHLEPVLQKWRVGMPKNVAFVGLPAVFQEGWAAYARAYYVAQDLKILDKTHAKLFHAMWEDKKQFQSLDEIANWYAGFGVTAQQFKDAFTAKGLDAKLKRAHEVTPKYEDEGTPTLIIDGKYRFDVTSAGGLEAVPGVLNFLIQKAATERATKKAS